MTSIRRREFLGSLARLGLASAAVAGLPAWAREAVAAGTARPARPAPALIIRNDRPEHLETPLSALGTPITPNDAFFVRSHFVPPTIDPATWKLEVAGLARNALSLTLADLRAMSQTETTCTLECAGNGRALFELPSTSGTQWERGAVGTAKWGGVLLSTVLAKAGVPPEAKHVWLEAADKAPIPAAPTFLRSIPLETAMKNTLLALTMNGAPLPARHGAPLRAIVPDWFGMASTKWLTRLRLETSPSDNHFMAKGYHYTYPGEDPATAPPVEEMRVKSLITRPLDGAVIVPGRVRIQGFAWAGSAGVKIVETSFDGGRSWQPAGFMTDRLPGAWRMWATEASIASHTSLTVMVRATDNAGDVQPMQARANAGGYGNNSIHKVTFRGKG